MAKQSGIHQLKGKVRGMSYYRQKGVADGLARSINQGLSKRVKEDAAYANTRLNAAEFGTVGAFAGACIRNISDRQRAMLKDFATGDLAKFLKSFIPDDTSNSWGSRTLTGIGDGSIVIDKINTYAKNDFSYSVGGTFETEITKGTTSNTWTPNANLPQGWGSPLAAKGATGAYVSMFAYGVSMNAVGNAPYKSVTAIKLVGETDAAIGVPDTIVTPTEVSADIIVGSPSGSIAAVLVVVRPYKEVNGEKYIMQELCTFRLVMPTIV